MRCLTVCLATFASVQMSHAEEAVALSNSGNSRLYEASASAPNISMILDNENLWGVALDPETETIYASSPTSGQILTLDWSNTGAGSTAVVTDATAVFHGLTIVDQSLYVLNSQTDSLQRYGLPIDPMDTPEEVCSGFTRPNDVAIDGDYIYVTDSGSDSIYVHARATGALVATVPFNGAWGVSVSPIDNVPYFSSYDDGTIVSLDVTQEQLTQVATSLQGPRGLEFDRNGTLFVFESDSNGLVTVDVSDGMKSSTSYTGSPSNGHDFLVVETLDLDGDFLPDAWERTHAPDLATLSPDTDDDVDAMGALVEYAFGKSPQSGQGGVTVTESWDPAGSSTLVLDVVDDPNILVSYEASNDLQTWSPVTAVSSEAAPTPGFDRDTVTVDPVSIFGSAQPELFFRTVVQPNR